MCRMATRIAGTGVDGENSFCLVVFTRNSSELSIVVFFVGCCGGGSLVGIPARGWEIS